MWRRWVRAAGWTVGVGLASAGASGCEGCDFSFGPVPVEVWVTPADRPVTVRVCAEAEEAPGGWFCQEQVADEAGYVSAGVSWHGYTTCKHPELLVEAEAEGCAPASATRDRQRPEPDDDGPVVFRLTLDCG